MRSRIKDRLDVIAAILVGLIEIDAHRLAAFELHLLGADRVRVAFRPEIVHDRDRFEPIGGGDFDGQLRLGAGLDLFGLAIDGEFRHAFGTMFGRGPAFGKDQHKCGRIFAGYRRLAGAAGQADQEDTGQEERRSEGSRHGAISDEGKADYRNSPHRGTGTAVRTVWLSPAAWLNMAAVPRGPRGRSERRGLAPL